jgi:hypothetical protein
MKTTSITFVLLAAAALLSQSCTKEYSRIEGIGQVTTQTLNIDEFSAIRLEGADDVEITYGTVQKVEVTGHPNIISRIKTEVRNGRWDMGLQNGNYGNYELQYSLTLPVLTAVEVIGSADVDILDSMETGEFELFLMGSGSFRGFQLRAGQSYVEIVGSGDCEITSDESMDVVIEGSGNVYYKGTPSLQTDITGSGRVLNAN